jgi:hypothetical protein
MDFIFELMIQKSSSAFVVKLVALGSQVRRLIPLVDRKNGE